MQFIKTKFSEVPLDSIVVSGKLIGKKIEPIQVGTDSFNFIESKTENKYSFYQDEDVSYVVQD